MPLESPVLDDRRFLEIVDELRKRIPEYCAEWTDINLSDPGITLLELFAWMTETMLYRLNRVPLLHYIKFMDLFGITLKPPQSAQVPVTFWFSAPQTVDIKIEAGTQISTTQTENTHPVIFAIKEDFMVRVPSLDLLLSGTPDGQRRHQYRDLSARKSVQSSYENIFSNQPRSGDAFYLGFNNDLSHHTLRIGFAMSELESSGLDEEKPPWAWEVSMGNEEVWVPCTPDHGHNTIGGFNRSGQIQLHLPRMGEVALNGNSRFWRRVRITDAQHTNPESRYITSPHLRYITGCHAVGGTIEAEHAQIIREETLGVSTGLPGQRFSLQAAPIVMPLKPNERLRVQVEGEKDQYWEKMESFAGKTQFARCYTLDGITGELRLGPAIRLQNGEILPLGQVPPKGAILVFERYRYGGGIIGNVEPGAIDTLKTAIPYISRVANRQKAIGGLDAQSIEEAMLEMPKRLRSRERAVTADDFEFLVENQFRGTVGRAICIPHETIYEANGVEHDASNQVDIRIIPWLTAQESYIEPNELAASADLHTLVGNFLDERRLLTTRLHVNNPQFHWVTVEVDVKAQPGVDTISLRDTILRRLYRFLNPLTGGSEGAGWPVGRNLRVWEIYQYLQSETGLSPRRAMLDLRQLDEMTIAMFAAQPDGSPTGQAINQLPVSRDGVIASGRHHVRFLSL